LLIIIGKNVTVNPTSSFYFKERCNMQFQTHSGYIQTQVRIISPHKRARHAELLTERRQRLQSLIEQYAQAHQCSLAASTWVVRSYPVLSVLAPVVTTHEDKIEFPGDPMCLYYALSVAIDQVLQTQQAGLSEHAPYNDLCPQWEALPSRDYRLHVSTSGIRDYTTPNLNTDQTIFDPRVWNDAMKSHFIKVLRHLNPHVVLISTVSAGHRYAIDIAATVKQILPECLTILGGRHVDETVRYDDATQQLRIAHSSPLAAIADGRIPAVLDFVSSGDGYFATDLLLKAISLAMDVETKRAKVAHIVEILNKLADVIAPVQGYSLLCALDKPQTHCFPIRGHSFDLGKLPPPYRPFAIRARFPIFFKPNGSVMRTAHFMTANACPYQCNFCSEGVSVVGRILKFGDQPIQTAINRLLECLSYGAESVFFDDSIFWAGNTSKMIEFCQALQQIRAGIGLETYEPWLQHPDDQQRLQDLQWGAQLTSEFLTATQFHDKSWKMLCAMRDAGCNYIYFGLESLAANIMEKVNKNHIKKNEIISWKTKMRNALELLKKAGIRAGCSVLFGLDGETRETIDETIDGVAQLIEDDLIFIASPNIATYHPGTALTKIHNMCDKIDYHSLDIDAHPPYTYFEEAFPGVVSKELTEADIWYIHQQTQLRWQEARNHNPMEETPIPTLDNWTYNNKLILKQLADKSRIT
jgi:radical SAM superfamily enzyme YgiQ (UPF0313 family)